MRRLAVIWIFAALVVFGGIAATYTTCPGCIDRPRDNARCEWIEGRTAPLNFNDPIDERHLVADAQLAEELAIRYADAEHARLTGYEGHGGLIESGRVRTECMARMVAAIERSHGVSAGQVQAARGRRNRSFDLAVALLFVPLYGFAAALISSRLSRRFAADSIYVRIAAVLLISVAASFVALQLFQLWVAAWEIVRVNNGHMSVFRAATYNSWHQRHRAALFAGGVIAFWLVALACWYSAHVEPRTCRSNDDC